MEKSTSPVADADNEFQAIRRRRAVGYVAIELFEFSFCLEMEDDRYSIAYLAFACFAR